MIKLITVFVTCLLGAAVLADSCAFTYQAVLRDEQGEIIKDEGNNPKRNHDVQIRLYGTATGGTPLWGRTYSVLTDENGLFNVAVSDTAGSKLNDAPQTTLDSVFKSVAAGSLFVGITVEGSAGEIVPRQCVFATPFAAVANDVRAVSGDLTVGGNITIGSGERRIVISDDGIDQRGGSSTVQKLSVNENADIAGTLKAGGGVLTAGGDGVTVKGHPLNVENTQLMVDGSEVVPVPVGGIIMWTKAALPDNVHWAVCNGEKGTPDLRARFVVGVGNVSGRGNYSYGDNGGKPEVALDIDQIPSHSHSYKYKAYDLAAAWKNQSNFYAVDHGSNWRSASTESAGGGKSHENRPPYYALYYIMRIK